MTDLIENIALLIDAENAPQSKMQDILDDLTKRGPVTWKRAYGDWSKPHLKKWHDTLNEMAILPVQQFAYTSGKNASDIAMVIEAMDLLHSQKYTSFALVTSDSDFTRLASRIREDQLHVFGYGEPKTPHSFRNACDEFVLVDYLGDERPASTKAATGTDGTIEVAQQADANLEKDLIALLTNAADEYGDDDGWILNGQAAQAIQRQRPDFSPRAFGCAKFVGVVRRLSEHFDLKRVKRGAGEAYVYRVKTDE